jgi:DNA-directed RNA polymerase subunit RPC12/RpoP
VGDGVEVTAMSDDTRVYRCDTCSRQFPHSDELEQDIYGYVCPECGGLYVTEVTVRE